MGPKFEPARALTAAPPPQPPLRPSDPPTLRRPSSQFIEDIPQTDVTSTLSMLSHSFCYLNSAINPIIYNHMNSKLSPFLPRPPSSSAHADHSL